MMWTSVDVDKRNTVIYIEKCRKISDIPTVSDGFEYFFGDKGYLPIRKPNNYCLSLMTRNERLTKLGKHTKKAHNLVSIKDFKMLR